MIYFFTKGDRKLPSSRARVFLVSDYLFKKGIINKVFIVKTKPWWDFKFSRFKENVRCIKILARVSNKDIVYLHKTIYQLDFIFLTLFFKFFFRKKYIFDFDDAIYLDKGHSNLKLKILLRFADKVVVSSQGLWEYAQEINKNVYIIETLIDTELYRPVNKILHNPIPTIGWIGSPVHHDNLEILSKSLQELISKGIKFNLLIVGASGNKKIHNMFNIPNLNVEIIDNLDWDNPEGTVAVINRFDIGVMPLINTLWNKSKSAYKLKEYMACGVAVIGSSVGENMNLIKDGHNGYLCNDNEWTSKLQNLIENREIRSNFSKNARATILKKYSFNSRIEDFLRIIKK